MIPDWMLNSVYITHDQYTGNKIIKTVNFNSEEIYLKNLIKTNT